MNCARRDDIFTKFKAEKIKSIKIGHVNMQYSTRKGTKILSCANSRTYIRVSELTFDLKF